MTNATIVIYIHKKKGPERKKKILYSKYDKTSEMGKQNKHYMYQLQRSVHIRDKSKQSVL